METLRRAVLRGFLTGLSFGLVALAYLLVEGHERPVKVAWLVATIAFMTWFVATPQAALELVAARRPDTLRRDLLAGVVGLVGGIPLVAGAFLQWVYFVALVEEGDLKRALDAVGSVGRDVLRDSEGWTLAAIFALPCGIVTFLRLRRTRWWLELPLSTGLTLAAGGPMFEAIKGRADGSVLLVIAGAGFPSSSSRQRSATRRIRSARARWTTPGEAFALASCAQSATSRACRCRKAERFTTSSGRADSSSSARSCSAIATETLP